MTHEFKTPDHPEANGRQPQSGESAYPLTFPLENGDTLIVAMGTEGFRHLSNVVLAMLTDAPSGRV